MLATLPRDLSPWTMFVNADIIVQAVMVGLAFALVKDLRSDPLVVRRKYAEEAIEQAVVTGVTAHGDDFVIAVDSDPEKSAGWSAAPKEEDAAERSG